MRRVYDGEASGIVDRIDLILLLNLAECNNVIEDLRGNVFERGNCE